MALTLITAPTVEPVSVADLKTHARISHDSEDAYLLRLEKVARRQAEEFTARAFLTQTWEIRLDGFPWSNAIELPYPPLQSITSVSYYDSANSLQVWATSNYEVDTPAGPHAEPGRLSLADGVSWPTTYSRTNAVLIRFVAGYGTAASDVPDDIVHAVTLRAGELYARREEVIVGMSQSPALNTFAALLWPYRVWLRPALDVR